MADASGLNYVSQKVKIVNAEDLTLQHRKERKELQGMILSLKKSSAKADKKKKKEVLEEIARLEFELDKRQSEELLNSVTQATLGLSIENEQATADHSTEQSNVSRVSKAQKRRDKKTIKSKERDQQILAQDAENVNGPRNLETQSIKKILKERQLMLHEIPSDGNCLYCAVDHQWQLVHGSVHGLQRLRSLTASHLRANMVNLLPFMTNPVTGDGLSEAQFEEYCSDTESTSAWGGEVELQALSEVLRCPIEVVQAVGPSVCVGNAKHGHPGLTLTYHRHMYGLGAHYNAVQPYVEEESPE